MSSTLPPADPQQSEGSTAQWTPQIASIRQNSTAHSRRVNWTFAGTLLVAVLVALAVWFVVEPRDRDANHLSAVMGIGLGVVLVGVIASRILLPRPPADCPRCGCDWHIESNNDLQVWLAWQNCPGCGLNLQVNTTSGRLESPG